MTQVSTAALVVALAGAPAFAQGPSNEVAGDVVIVTGTRITNPNLAQASQVQVVGEDEVRLKGATSAEELIRQLPGVSPGTGAQVNNGNNGAATLNLRNIGTNRNIVLLDSQRVVPFDTTGVTDTNLIPIALIDRTEIVTGGASTVYGADAISGVVNFVTKKDFQGVDFTTGFRITEEGDGQTFRTDLTVGGNFDDGKGNAVVSLNYLNAKPVLQGDRFISTESLGSSTRNPILGVSTSPICTQAGLTGSDCNVQGSGTAAPGNFFFPTFGNPNPLGAGIDPVAGIVTATSANNYNFSPLNLFQTPQERWKLFGQGHYEITPNIEAYSRGFFVRSFVEANLAPSGTFANQWQLPLSNPYLPVGIRNQLCANVTPIISPAACAAAAAATSAADPAYREVAIQYGRRFVEAGPRVQQFTSNAFQFTFGLKGDISPTWKFDVSGQYGASTISEVRTGWGLASRVQQALRAFNQNACSVTTGGCVPLNLFGPAGSITDAQLNYVANVATFSNNDTSLSTFLGVVNGDLGSFKSPWADNPIGVALGAEYREYVARRNADVSTQTANEVLGAGAPQPTFRGRYDTYEGFAELIAPVFEDRPFVKSFQIEGGARYSKYSNAGGKFTWKAGATWMFSDDAKIRAVYQRASRAPNIFELFSPQVVGLNNLTTDPCQGALPVGNAALTALCIATGVPSAQIGLVGAPVAGQINQTTGGNPNLGVETASTFTSGLVLTPRAIPNLTFTVDYFNILIRDAVSVPTVGDIVNGCYATALNPSLAFNQFCALIGRNPLSGALGGPQATTPGVILARSNLGTVRTSGFDWTVGYRHDLGEMGRLAYNMNGTFTLENKFQANANAINRECVGFYGLNCDPVQSKWQFNQRLTWSWDAIDLSLQHRFLSSTAVEPIQPGVATLVVPFKTIGSRNYFDLTGRWAVNKIVDATVTINNLLNQQPPLVGNTIGTTGYNSGNTFPSTYDALGRTYSFQLRARF